MILLAILAPILVVLLMNACPFPAGPRVERASGAATGSADAIAAALGNLRGVRIRRPLMPAVRPFGILPSWYKSGWRWASTGPP